MEFETQNQPLPMDEPNTQGVFKNVKNIQIGAGNTQFNAGKEGVFMGADNFTDAPFSVDLDGVQYLGVNDEIILDGVNKKITVGTGNEIILDGVNKKITVGGVSGSDIVIDGVTGTITTDKIQDKTYGLNGVFCSTHTSTNTSGNYSFRIDGPGTSDIPTNGGLLNVSLNYLDASGNYKLLPGYNTATAKPYYYAYKLDGYYRIYYYAGNIFADVAHTTLYFTTIFNSLETSGW